VLLEGPGELSEWPGTSMIGAWRLLLFLGSVLGSAPMISVYPLLGQNYDRKATVDQPEHPGSI